MRRLDLTTPFTVSQGGDTVGDIPQIPFTENPWTGAYTKVILNLKQRGHRFSYSNIYFTYLYI